MIDFSIMETDVAPESFSFDVCIAAVGYESRCSFVVECCSVVAKIGIALDFGFLQEGAYSKNVRFFEALGFQIIPGLADSAVGFIANRIVEARSDCVRVLVDVSSMSREMIANVVLAIASARYRTSVLVTCSYAPSIFTGGYGASPIRLASPIKREFAGWSSRPDKPLGLLLGLGCEPGLALGAAQVLEPAKGWAFSPLGFDERFQAALLSANSHLTDIFDVTVSEYDISQPTVTRSKIDALITAVSPSYRLIAVPFGPKVFSWLMMTTAMFNHYRELGVWAFSSKEQAAAVDREPEGRIVWHSQYVAKADVK
jgi:hypothetical protein